MKDGMLYAEEIEAIVRGAVRDEFEAVGLRVDDSDHQDEARSDFNFLRKLRKAVDGTASKVGSAIILALVSGLLWLLWVGIQAAFPSK